MSFFGMFFPQCGHFMLELYYKACWASSGGHNLADHHLISTLLDTMNVFVSGSNSVTLKSGAAFGSVICM